MYGKGVQRQYKLITQLLKNSTTGRIFNETLGSPFFNYVVKTFSIKIPVLYNSCLSLFRKHSENLQVHMVLFVSYARKKQHFNNSQVIHISKIHMELYMHHRTKVQFSFVYADNALTLYVIHCTILVHYKVHKTIPWLHKHTCFMEMARVEASYCVEKRVVNGVVYFPQLLCQFLTKKRKFTRTHLHSEVDNHRVTA